MFKFLKEKLKKLVKKSEEKIEKKEKQEKQEKQTKEKKPKIIKKILKPKVIEKEDIEEVFEELEVELIQADVAYQTIEKIKSKLEEKLVGKEIGKKKVAELVKQALKEVLIEMLDAGQIDLIKESEKAKPYLIVFMGFNGHGKTTSIAKLANYLLKNNKTVVLAAADTFRAASIEQLEEHAKKLGLKVIKHDYGADPAAVIFDAVKHAKAKGIDFVLADTAGRSHANVNLMEELEKIIRVNKPNLKVLVIDSLTGSDTLNQARNFGKVGVDAFVFTKVDVNEKGGNIITAVSELRKPILFLGTGQSYDDLQFFNAKEFVENLLS